MTRLLSKANHSREMHSRYDNYRKLLLLALHELLVVLRRMGADFQAISLEALVDSYDLLINVVCKLSLEISPDLVICLYSKPYYVRFDWLIEELKLYSCIFTTVKLMEIYLKGYSLANCSLSQEFDLFWLLTWITIFFLCGIKFH